MYRMRPGLEDAFLAGVGEDDEEEMEVDVDIVKEVGRSYILHWNYRGLTCFPAELLGEYIINHSLST